MLVAIDFNLLTIQRSKARLYGLRQLDAAIDYALQGKPIRPGQMDLNARILQLEAELARLEPKAEPLPPEPLPPIPDEPGDVEVLTAAVRELAVVLNPDTKVEAPAPIEPAAVVDSDIPLTRTRARRTLRKKLSDA